MKFFKLLTCVSAMFMLGACAQTRTDVETKLGYVEKMENQATIAGSHRIEIVRTVTWMSRSACSVLDFVSIVTSQDSTIHDVINIRADEGKTSVDDGEVKGYSCKYWGLAVRYVPMDVPQPSVAPVAALPVCSMAQPAPVAAQPVRTMAQPVAVRPVAAPAPVRQVAPQPAPAPAPARPAQVAPAPVPAPATSSGPKGESFVPSVDALQK